MATLDFSIALLKTFKLGPALFQDLKEAMLSEPLSHSPIHLAVSMTVSESFIKLSLAENGKESSGLLITPMHAYDLLILKTPVILSHPAFSLSLGC